MRCFEGSLTPILTRYDCKTRTRNDEGIIMNNGFLLQIRRSMGCHLINDQNPAYLLHIGDEILPRYIGTIISHEIRIPS